MNSIKQILIIFVLSFLSVRNSHSAMEVNQQSSETKAILQIDKSNNFDTPLAGIYNWDRFIKDYERTAQIIHSEAKECNLPELFIAYSLQTCEAKRWFNFHANKTNFTEAYNTVLELLSKSQISEYFIKCFIRPASNYLEATPAAAYLANRDLLHVFGYQLLVRLLDGRTNTYAKAPIEYHNDFTNNLLIGSTPCFNAIKILSDGSVIATAIGTFYQDKKVRLSVIKFNADSTTSNIIELPSKLASPSLCNEAFIHIYQSNNEDIFISVANEGEYFLVHLSPSIQLKSII